MNWLKNIWNKIKNYFQNKETTIENKVKADVVVVNSYIVSDVKAVEDVATAVVNEVEQGV